MADGCELGGSRPTEDHDQVAVIVRTEGRVEVVGVARAVDALLHECVRGRAELDPLDRGAISGPPVARRAEGRPKGITAEHRVLDPNVSRVQRERAPRLISIRWQAVGRDRHLSLRQYRGGGGW